MKENPYRPKKKAPNQSLDAIAERRLGGKLRRLFTLLRHYEKSTQNELILEDINELLSWDNFHNPYKIKEHTRKVEDRLWELTLEFEELMPELVADTIVELNQDVSLERRAYTSEYEGVSYFPSSNMWRARLWIKGTGEAEVKYERTEMEAAQTFDRMLRERYPEEKHRLNFYAGPRFKHVDAFNVHQKREIINKALSKEKIESAYGKPYNYLRRAECDDLIKKHDIKLPTR